MQLGEFFVQVPRSMHHTSRYGAFDEIAVAVHSLKERFFRGANGGDKTLIDRAILSQGGLSQQ